MAIDRPRRFKAGEQVSARKLNAMVDKLQQAPIGGPAGPASLGLTSMLINNTGSDREAGEIVRLGGAWDGPSDFYDAQSNAVGLSSAVTWHTAISRLGVTSEPHPSGEALGVVVAGLVVARFTNDPALGDFAMVDPTTTHRFKASTGGIARIVYKIDATTAVIDLSSQQRLWQYRLNAASAAPSDTSADLLDLAGNEFSSSILLSDPRSIGSDDAAGYIGYCYHVGNQFHISVGPC